MSYNFNDKTKCLIKKIVNQKFITDWKKKLYQTDMYPIMKTYALFKFDFKIEPYLIHIKNRKYRNAMIKFRTSSHKLEIEKGRHACPKIPVEKRLCKICNVIESEMHFLLHCKLYNSAREQLMKDILELYPIFNQFSDEDKMAFALSYNDPQILTLTSKFIFHAFEIRNHSLES